MISWNIESYQPGDGTNYTFHVMKHVYGGYLVCSNDSSMWLYFTRDHEIKFLCGNDNKYTAAAIQNYMTGLNL